VKSFLTEEFLLQSETARALYFDHAESLPILDFHNHLPPEDIARNRCFANLTEAWLEDDHYKWRAMRTWGIDESFCTGDADPREKFLRWAEVVPYTLGNPLYHWTHMELANPFGIKHSLNLSSASEVYEQASALLQTPEFYVQGLLANRNVEVVCTTDDPTSTLEHHLRSTSIRDLTVLPTFRVDALLETSDSTRFNEMLERLSRASSKSIGNFDDYCDAIEDRHTYFHDIGCRLSDAGVSSLQFVEPRDVEKAFTLLRAGKTLDQQQQAVLSTATLLWVSELNARREWVQQFHLGALRDANSRKVEALGQGRGFDSIGGYDNTLALQGLLDRLNREDHLAKTILYNLNPADNEIFTTMAANFNEGDVRGKVQHGAAWWFLDQKHGIESHLMSVSSLGLLSCFVGMLTDSRSFLSFSRHEYFRRILCNFLGAQVESGEMPSDLDLLGDIVRRVCYYNAKDYFPFASQSEG